MNPTQLGVSGSPKLGLQADINMIGGPGVVIPQSLGIAPPTVANIPPPGVVTAGLATSKPLPKGNSLAYNLCAYHYLASNFSFVFHEAVSE